MFRKILSLAGFAPAALALACTPFEPATDELLDPNAGSPNAAGTSATSTAVDALTPEKGRDWSCIGPLDTAQNVVRSNANAARLVQSLQLLSLVAGTPPTGSVRACAQRDVNCTNPVTPSVTIDPQGWVDLPLYDGFDGYLEITGPDIVSTILFYQDALSTESRRDTTPLGVVETQLLPMLTSALGTLQDPQLGLVYLRAFDCKNDAALGVRYSIDRASVPFYFVAGLPSSAVTETEGSGLGGFINVASGIAVVNATLSNGAKPIALPKTLLVRPNWMTGLRIIPALRPPDEAQ
jgi:hypothetical protein